MPRRNVSGFVAVLMFVTTAGFLPAPHAAASYDPAVAYKIVNRNSGTLLSVHQAGTDNGSPIVIWDDVNAEDQFWHIIEIGNGYYELINKHSGRALSTLEGGSTNGIIIHLWDYLTTYPDQHWAITAVSDGYVMITNENSGRAVSCKNAGTANDTTVHLWDYLGGYPDQDWLIVPADQTVDIDANMVTANVSTTMTGVCMEDVNHEVYGGIYSQMIFGESFQEPENAAGVSGMWRPMSSGTATAQYCLDGTSPFKGSQSQKITFTGGSGQVGVENQSLNRWGMNVQAGGAYDGYLYARAKATTKIYVALESSDGAAVYAEASFTANSANWKRYDFTLTPNASNVHGRFAIKLKKRGSINVGHAFIEPGAWGRFNGLPVRKDIGEGLVAQGNTVMRFGGSAINSAYYRWKNMIGPRDQRPTTGGTWYPYESNGWGIFDFLNFTEAAGVLGIPAINMDETPQDMADFMEYVNGSTTTPWGQQRANDGHPAPYNLRYLELGNEEAVNETYYGKFQALATAIWAKDPNVILVVGDFAYFDVITDPFSFTGSPVITTLAAHQKILNLATANNREVWFDVHLSTEVPDSVVSRQNRAMHSFYQQLGAISPGARYQVAVFELNAGRHDMNRALGNALAIGMAQRIGNEVRIVASANALQPDGQNDNGWDQGLLFLNPAQTWSQPPYYVTQMISANYLPLTVQATPSGRESLTFDVTATKSSSGTAMTLQIVNVIDAPRRYSIRFNGFTPTQPTAHVTTLSAAANAVNTAANPNAVVPVETEEVLDWANGTLTYTFAPRSFTVLRLE